MSKEKEEWRPVKGFEGQYEVSDWGRIRSVDRVVIDKNGKKYFKRGRLLIPGRTTNGYHTVGLTKKVRALSLHRLVAETFIPNPDNKPCVDHINTVKTDNRAENLRWVTHSENMLNSLTRKRIKNNGHQKKVYQYDLKGNFLKEFDSITEASESVNAQVCQISACCQGRVQSSNGFQWSFEKKEMGLYENQVVKQVYQYTIEGELVGVYVSATEAQRQTGFYRKTISKCCKGERKTYKGYIWSYIPL